MILYLKKFSGILRLRYVLDEYLCCTRLLKVAMYTRRSFLASASAALAMSSLPRIAYATAPPSRAFGLQLYTVRKDIQADTPGVLAAVRKIGYRSVETFAAQYSRPAKELRQMISDADLFLPSAHFGYTDLSEKFDYAKELGVKYIVVGAPPFQKANSADAFKEFAAQYNQWGQEAAKYGMEFGFHNHNIEFQSFDGVTGLEILMKETDPKLVKWQMDCYWVTQAGADPVAMIHKYGERLQTLHFKDRKPNVPTSAKPGAPAHFTEVGTGTINFKAIWVAASPLHVPYFFVEQDQTEIPPLESIKISYNNLRKILQ
ncbi:sugar phosphate isomerase/epimerase family protein [Edaphobacter dinghuensis]|uniref:Xylose isomerase n=2 Tax=Edaphobacter dinghuensis TaxID=1560005 RepID=A0A917H0U0_9BACT|nr:sugar phosphate isomerase/epimerase [Edaphobacter dinghuensis]GGG63220.1 xylose isomerase [Edaphobacter dinghuensis]